MNWQALAIKAARVAEKLLRKLARKKHEKTVAEINSARLAQTRLPRSGKWVVIDRESCEIVGTSDELVEGVEVVK